jgi:RHS repeat-associated protein
MKTINGSWQTNEYRYGYNGMEKDPETKGEGNSYTTEFRQYDPRLGRWMSLDPMMTESPWQSPYCAFDNNPIFYTDPYGLAAGPGDSPAGLPADPTHEQIATAEDGKEYQYVVNENGEGAWGMYNGEFTVTDYKSGACEEYKEWIGNIGTDGINEFTEELYQHKIGTAKYWIRPVFLWYRRIW